MPEVTLKWLRAGNKVSETGRIVKVPQIIRLR